MGKVSVVPMAKGGERSLCDGGEQLYLFQPLFCQIFGHSWHSRLGGLSHCNFSSFQFYFVNQGLVGVSEMNKKNLTDIFLFKGEKENIEVILSPRMMVGKILREISSREKKGKKKKIEDISMSCKFSFSFFFDNWHF